MRLAIPEGLNHVKISPHIHIARKKPAAPLRSPVCLFLLVLVGVVASSAQPQESQQSPILEPEIIAERACASEEG